MGKAMLGCFAVLAVLSLAVPAAGQGTFEFKVVLPDLDADPVIQGDVGTDVQFDADLVLGSSGIEGEEGAQGWSLGVSHENVELVETTYAGTESAQAEVGGFVVLETIDPAKNAGKNGVVEAVVLSFRKPVSLAPNAEHVVAKNVYRATIPATKTQAIVKFEEGLRGSGQPVANNVTFKGLTKVPTLGEKTISLEPPAVDISPVEGLQCTLDAETKTATLAWTIPAGQSYTMIQVRWTGAATGSQDLAADATTFTTAALPDGSTTFTVQAFVEAEGAPSSPSCTVEVTPVCVPDEPEKELTCDDGKDNDCDGLIDMDDPDCLVLPDQGLALAMNAPGGTLQGAKYVAAVSGATVEASGYIEPVGDPLSEGAQGWSISVSHEDDSLDLVSVTIGGTDAGAAFSGGFESTEVVDPAKNAGNAGFVSAVVLSFRKAISLDPTKAQSVIRAQYDFVGDWQKTQIVFLDDLRGSGQPVPNVITVAGKTVEPAAKFPLELSRGEPPAKSRFVRGDANDDGKTNIADPIWIINELVREGPATECQSAADANDDGLVDLSDAMYLIMWRFKGGPQPPVPFTACGLDPTADDLACPPGSVTRCP